MEWQKTAAFGWRALKKWEIKPCWHASSKILFHILWESSASFATYTHFFGNFIRKSVHIPRFHFIETSVFINLNILNHAHEIVKWYIFKEHFYSYIFARPEWKCHCEIVKSTIISVKWEYFERPIPCHTNEKMNISNLSIKNEDTYSHNPEWYG